MLLIKCLFFPVVHLDVVCVKSVNPCDQQERLFKVSGGKRSKWGYGKYLQSVGECC